MLKIENLKSLIGISILFCHNFWMLHSKNSAKTGLAFSSLRVDTRG